MNLPAVVRINSPLGPLLAAGDEKTLHYLKFIEEHEQQAITSEWTTPLSTVARELEEYFEGKRRHFETPLHLSGTPFQKCVWEELLKIPSGKTRSYGDIAQSIGRPTAYRAVANANAANKFAIIIPCHRVINNNGKLGGYRWGIERKEKLLSLEKDRNLF